MNPFKFTWWRFGYAKRDWDAISGYRKIFGRLYFLRLRWKVVNWTGYNGDFNIGNANNKKVKK